jgi:hypothetical protein
MRHRTTLLPESGSVQAEFLEDLVEFIGGAAGSPGTRGNYPAHRLTPLEDGCMALSAGTRLGPYEILSPIGAGGSESVGGSGWNGTAHQS